MEACAEPLKRWREAGTCIVMVPSEAAFPRKVERTCALHPRTLLMYEGGGSCTHVKCAVNLDVSFLFLLSFCQFFFFFFFFFYILVMKVKFASVCFSVKHQLGTLS